MNATTKCPSASSRTTTLQGQQQSDVGFGVQGGGKRRIACAEDPIRADFDAELGFPGGLDIDFGEDTEAFSLEFFGDAGDGLVESQAGELAVESVGGRRRHRGGGGIMKNSGVLKRGGEPNHPQQWTRWKLRDERAPELEPLVRPRRRQVARLVTSRPVRSLRFRPATSTRAIAVTQCGGRMSRFPETNPQVYTREDLAEQEAKRRAIVFGLLCALISAMLTVGAIASLVMAFG